MRSSPIPASGTETCGRTPKYVSESETPMNSVMMMRKLTVRMLETAIVPQSRPNRSRTSRACPTPETAPSRATISWFTTSTGMHRTRVHSSVSP